MTGAIATIWQEGTGDLVLIGIAVLGLAVLAAVILLGSKDRSAIVRNTWTVARHTFSQCLRTKVAAVFGIMLAVSLALLPWAMEGDGTLAGRIRTFLDYSTTVTSVLLSLIVIFLSVAMVSGDIRDRHVYLVCTKPLGRWHYIVGRWLGVVLLSAVLLAASAATVYVLAQYLRSRSDLVVNPEDRRTVETEVFAARAEVLPDPPDVTAVVAERVKAKKRDGSWDGAIESYRMQYQLDANAAGQRLLAEMAKNAMAEAQSIGPGRSLAWDFSGARVTGSKHAGRGRVRAVSRAVGLVAIETDPDLATRLIIYGPVQVNGVTGRVIGRWKTGFRATFHLEDMKTQGMVDLRRGSEVNVVVEPTIMISYKVTPGGPGGGRAYRAAWKVENPTTGFVYDEPLREVPMNTRVTLVAPARVADGEGRLRARYINYSAASVIVDHRDVAVLYRVGSFEANFLKTIALMLMGLMFLAALGTWAGSFVSFPVGCVVCFGTLPFTVLHRFVEEAIEMIRLSGEQPIWYNRYSQGVLVAMQVLLPDLLSTLGTDFVRDGLVIPWLYLAKNAAVTVALRAAALLALACLIFSRRELARVQV